MRKIILNLAVSLDGYIEDPDGGYDWCFNDQDYGMTNFLNSTDAMFAGRKSYELLMDADPEIFGAVKMYVFSDTLTQTGAGLTEIINRANFKTRVGEIINQPGGNIWLFGGSGLVTSFITHNLVSELVLSVHPVILGGGKALFAGIDQRTDLLLLGTEQFPSGLVQLRYALKPQFDLSMIDF